MVQTCPHCKGDVSVDDGLSAGIGVTCPYCQNTFAVGQVVQAARAAAIEPRPVVTQTISSGGEAAAMRRIHTSIGAVLRVSIAALVCSAVCMVVVLVWEWRFQEFKGRMNQFQENACQSIKTFPRK